MLLPIKTQEGVIKKRIIEEEEDDEEDKEIENNEESMFEQNRKDEKLDDHGEIDSYLQVNLWKLYIDFIHIKYVILHIRELLEFNNFLTPIKIK